MGDQAQGGISPLSLAAGLSAGLQNPRQFRDIGGGFQLAEPRGQRLARGAGQALQAGLGVSLRERERELGRQERISAEERLFTRQQQIATTEFGRRQQFATTAFGRTQSFQELLQEGKITTAEITAETNRRLLEQRGRIAETFAQQEAIRRAPEAESLVESRRQRTIIEQQAGERAERTFEFNKEQRVFARQEAERARKLTAEFTAVSLESVKLKRDLLAAQVRAIPNAALRGELSAARTTAEMINRALVLMTPEQSRLYRQQTLGREDLIPEDLAAIAVSIVQGETEFRPSPAPGGGGRTQNELQKILEDISRERTGRR